MGKKESTIWSWLFFKGLNDSKYVYKLCLKEDLVSLYIFFNNSHLHEKVMDFLMKLLAN